EHDLRLLESKHSLTDGRRFFLGGRKPGLHSEQSGVELLCLEISLGEFAHQVLAHSVQVADVVFEDLDALLEPLVLFPELANVAVVGFVALSAALQVGVLTFELGDYSLCFFGGLCERIALDSDLCYLMGELRYRLFEFVFSPGRLFEWSAVALFLNSRSKP